jgi:hypothetical protein
VEAKWSSFRAPEHALKNLGLLTHSFGFFSLTADTVDGWDRDRAYVLDRGRLREVNTRGVLSRDTTPPGLYQHFEWCRMCYYSHHVDYVETIATPVEPNQVPEFRASLDMAGWFFIPDRRSDFSALLDLFVCREGVAISECSLSGNQYLLLGEENQQLEKILVPLVEASRRFPLGRGLLYLLGKPRIPQIGILDGECYYLSPLEPDEWSYHEEPLFWTANFGYDKR